MTNGLLAAVVAALLTAAQTPAPIPVGLASVPPQPVEGISSAPLQAIPADDPPVAAGAPTAWVTADYLVTWMKGVRVPPLLTTSPPGTARAVAGILDQPNTTTLFQGWQNEGARSGFRIDAGTWLFRDEGLQLEAGASVIESRSAGINATSDGSRILARPFVNALTGQPDAILVAFPDANAGDVSIRNLSGNFYEAHVTVAKTIPCTSFDALIGYRFFRYDEALTMRQRLRPIGLGAAFASEVDNRDEFSARNEFHGLDLGVRGQFGSQDLTFDVLAKVAVGQLRRRLAVRGTQVETPPAGPAVTQTGGVFALASNLHTLNDTEWGAIPELGVGVAYRLRDNTLLRLGYSVLWLSGITRAGEMVDTTLNPNLFPPATNPSADPQRPAPLNPRTDMWIQTLSLGLVFTY